MASSSIGVIIAVGVIGCVALAAGLLHMRAALRRWIAWARVRREQRRRERERRVMLRYQKIGSGAWKRK